MADKTINTQGNEVDAKTENRKRLEELLKAAFAASDQISVSGQEVDYLAVIRGALRESYEIIQKEEETASAEDAVSASENAAN